MEAMVFWCLLRGAGTWDRSAVCTYLHLSQSPLQVLDYKGILGRTLALDWTHSHTEWEEKDRKHFAWHFQHFCQQFRNETTAAAVTTSVCLCLKCFVSDHEAFSFISEVQPTGTVFHAENKPKGGKKIKPYGFSHSLQQSCCVESNPLWPWLNILFSSCCAQLSMLVLLES